MRLSGALAVLAAMQGVGISVASVAFVSPSAPVAHRGTWASSTLAHDNLQCSRIRPSLRSGCGAARMMQNLPGMDSELAKFKAAGTKDTSRTQVEKVRHP
jgi:hypothetical protein